MPRRYVKPTILQVDIRTSKEFEDVSRALRRADRSIKRDTTTACKRIVAVTLRKLRRSARRIRVRGYRVDNNRSGLPFTEDLEGSHILERIALATVGRVRLMRMPVIDYFVNNERLGSAKRLPGFFEQQKIFRHPLPNTRRQWAASQGSPWFRRVVDKDMELLKERIDRELDRTRRDIGG